MLWLQKLLKHPACMNPATVNSPEMIEHLKLVSLYCPKDDAFRLLFMRRSLLPLQTQRLLDASGYCMPGSFHLPGFIPVPGSGICCDPLLLTLRDRYLSNFQRRLLPAAGADAATIATETKGMTGMNLTPQDIILLHFLNYRVSIRRRRDPPLQDISQPNNPPPRDREFMMSPLAYSTIDNLCRTKPYNNALYDHISDLLPTHVPFSTVPDSSLFISAVISYWLLQNPPYQRPLPGQSAATSISIPSSAAAAAAAAASSNGSLSGPGWNPVGHFGPAGPDRSSFSVDYSSTSSSVGLSTLTSSAGLSNRSGFVGGAVAAVASAEEPSAQPPSAYFPPSIELLEATNLLLQLQMCDNDFPMIINGTNVPKSGGPRILQLALDALHGWDAASYGAAAPTGAVNPATAAEVLQACRGLRSLEGGRRKVPDPTKLHAELPGIVEYPQAWAELHAPLFHFLRNHIARAPFAAGTDVVTFICLIDTWCNVLAPWRARCSLKDCPPSADSRRRYRHYAYSAVAAEQLKQKVAAIRSRPGFEADGPHPHRAGSAAASAAAAGPSSPAAAGSAVLGGGRRRMRMVTLSDRDTDPALRFSLEDAAAGARKQDYYESCMHATQDWASALMPAASECWNVERVIASRNAAAANTFAAGHHDKFESWIPWIRLHYLFYVHLLQLLLGRLGQGTFTTDPPVLLEALERVLDIFEPRVVAVLKDCESQWRDALFTGSSGATSFGQVSGIGGAAADKGVLAARLQLLAHRTLLKLPPDVQPSALAPSMAELAVDAREVIARLQASIASSSLPKPSPIPLPEATRIILHDKQGRPQVFEHLPYWHGAELWLSDWLALIGSPVTLSMQVYWKLQPASPAAERLRTHWANVAAEFIIAPLELIAHFWNVLLKALEEVFNSIIGAPPASPVSTSAIASAGVHSPRTSAIAGVSVTNVNRIHAERIQLSIDRLSRLFEPTAPVESLNVPSFFQLQSYKMKPLLGSVQRMLAEFWEWIAMTGPVASAADAQILDPRVQSHFGHFNAAGELAPAEVSAILESKARMYEYQSAFVGSADERPAGTWESSVLILLTAAISSRILAVIAQVKPQHGSAQSVSRRNFLRRFADIRVLTLSILYANLCWYVGFRASSTLVVIAYLVLRCCM